MPLKKPITSPEKPYQQRLKEAEEMCKDIKDADKHLECVKDQMNQKPTGTKTVGKGFGTYEDHKTKLVEQFKQMGMKA